MNEQLFLGQKLESAVPFHIDGVPEISVICREHRDNDAAFMIVRRSIDFIANRKFRRRELPQESSMIIISRDYSQCVVSKKLNQMDIMNDPELPKRFGGVFVPPQQSGYAVIANVRIWSANALQSDIAACWLCG